MKIELSSTRFWRKVIKSVDGCWEWVGSINNKGYGQFRLNRNKTIKAHRYAWILINGPIPEGLCVLHHCDNPSCCNPSHLFLGTNLDNVRDKMSKNRCAKLVGVSNPSHKLSEFSVREIRNLFSTGEYSLRKLGRMYGVSHYQISRIVDGRSWRNTK